MLNIKYEKMGKGPVKVSENRKNQKSHKKNEKFGKFSKKKLEKGPEKPEKLRNTSFLTKILKNVEHLEKKIGKGTIKVSKPHKIKNQFIPEKVKKINQKIYRKTRRQC